MPVTRDPSKDSVEVSGLDLIRDLFPLARRVAGSVPDGWLDQVADNKVDENKEIDVRLPISIIRAARRLLDNLTS